MVDPGVRVDETDSYTMSYVIPTQADILIAYSTVEGTHQNRECLSSSNWNRRTVILSVASPIGLEAAGRIFASP